MKEELGYSYKMNFVGVGPLRALVKEPQAELNASV